MANVRVEWLLFDTIDNKTVTFNLNQSQVLTCNTTAQANSLAAPGTANGGVFTGRTSVYAKVTPLDQPVYVIVSANASTNIDSNGNTATLVLPGEPVNFKSSVNAITYVLQAGNITLSGETVTLATGAVVALANSENHLGAIGGEAGVWVASDATITRPNNANGYVAFAAIGNSTSTLFTWTNFFRKNGDTGLLTGLRLAVTSNTSSNTAQMGTVRAHLYNVTPNSAPASDQATFTTIVARTGGLGYVDLSTWSIGGTGSDTISSYGVPALTPLPINAAANSRNLYVLIESTSSFTPANSAIYQPSVSAVFD